MGIYIFLLPSSFCAEEMTIISEIICERMKDKEDTLMVFQNNINKYQLLSADKYSGTQMQRKIDKLNTLYNKIIMNTNKERVNKSSLFSR